MHLSLGIVRIGLTSAAETRLSRLVELIVGESAYESVQVCDSPRIQLLGPAIGSDGPSLYCLQLVIECAQRKLHFG